MDQYKKRALPADVAQKYELKGIEVGAYVIPGYGVVDFSKLSLAKADQLAGRGFPYLVAKETPAAPVKAAIKPKADAAQDESETDTQSA